MRIQWLLALCGGSLARSEPVYLTWLADTFIKSGVQPPSFDYQQATLYLGFEKAYEFSKDDKYLEWYKNQIDGYVVQDDGTINGWNESTYSVDDYRMANNYLYLYETTGKNKYKGAADIVRRHLNSHPRMPSGGFWHRAPIFANQMWLDGIFMADSFYAKWTDRFDKDNTTAWDDVFLQYDLAYTHTVNDTTGLMVHGWAQGDTAPWADPVTGRAPHVWGRAMGWYFMSLIETLQVFPQSHPRYAKLRDYCTSLAGALVEAQDPNSHGWWQVMDDPYPAMEGNYIESSGSAMFTYGLLKAIDLGYIDRDTFLNPAKDAYHGLVDKFIEPQGNGTLLYTGTVSECGLSAGNVTFEYYISAPVGSNDYKGSGPFMLAAYEWETWAKDAET